MMEGEKSNPKDLGLNGVGRGERVGVYWQSKRMRFSKEIFDMLGFHNYRAVFRYGASRHSRA